MPYERALRRAGIAPDAFVRAQGMDPAYLRGDERLSHSDALKLLDAAIAATGDPLLPLHAGELVRPGDFDALEYAARATTNLREAIVRVDRYVRLMHDAVRLPLQVKGSLAIWTVEVESGLQFRAENEYVISLLLGAARMVTGLHLRPQEVHLPGPAPSDPAEYTRVLSDIVRWEAPVARMVFPAAALSFPLPNPNPRLAAALAEHADRLLDELVQTEQVTRRVREQIVPQLPAGGITIEDVADNLNMSARTLRRRLAAEGTTFVDQIDQLRRDLGVDHVRRGELTLTEISFLLGFSNLGAFHKAFRRWTGQSPSEYRESLDTHEPRPARVVEGQNVSPGGPHPRDPRRR